MTKLIITNGDMAAERISKIQPEAKVLPWRDVLHEGPLTLHESLPDQSEERAAFIADFADQPLEQVQRDFAERDQTFLKATEYDRVELWFEHDLYDQLQLLQILYFAKQYMPDVDLYLVQADDYLCELSDRDFENLPQKAMAVTQAQAEYAQACWQALMTGQAIEETGPLPYVAQALARFEKEKAEIPHSLILAARPLRDGCVTVLEMFKAMQAAEEAKFMGDLSFYHMIRRFLVGEDALFQGAYEEGMEYRVFFDLKLELTALGRAKLL